ncbi:MAG: hypothetical protein GOMPHAMPRED_005998 [Gomphillus americanus]|uniref:Uncharacterized protein n=1 Tax=Gomphillus americanus TaxID=1940652 RepID=A0A8H3EPH8_9LECA|nr:MAG: hypothetical protein GOMPHAMPRED_005998 [Gomphillus americanus]
MTDWQVLNASPSTLPSDLSKPFTLTTPANTDLWRSDEHKDAHNAPAFYRVIKTSSFKRLAVTISANWTDLYDQGGILLLWPNTTNAAEANAPKQKWIKAGIEMVGGQAQFSCVVCDRFSDWSLHPLEGKQRIEAVREGDALWILAGGKRIREPKFAFIEERKGDAEMWIGVTAAKPSKEGELQVRFEDLEIEVV